MSGATSMLDGDLRHSRQNGHQPDREQQTGRPAGQAERETFRQELAPDASSTRAEREPYADLAPARNRAGQEKVRDVDARQQEHEGDRRHHDDDDERDRRGVLPAAAGERLEAHARQRLLRGARAIAVA